MRLNVNILHCAVNICLFVIFLSTIRFNPNVARITLNLSCVLLLSMIRSSFIFLIKYGRKIFRIIFSRLFCHFNNIAIFFSFGKCNMRVYGTKNHDTHNLNQQWWIRDFSKHRLPFCAHSTCASFISTSNFNTRTTFHFTTQFILVK